MTARLDLLKLNKGRRTSFLEAPARSPSGAFNLMKKEIKIEQWKWEFKKLLDLLLSVKEFAHITFNPEGYLQIVFKQEGNEITIQLFPDQKWKMFWNFKQV